MNWWRQVGHVFQRDVGRTSKALTLFAAVLCVAVARAVEWQPAMQGATAMVGVLVLIGAAVAVALVVLADGTTRADAFWAVQPLHSSAVATSKVAYAVMLVSMIGLATFLTLLTWGLVVQSLDAAGARICTVLLLLLGIALIASTCDDLKSVVPFIGVVGGLNVFTTFVLEITQLRVTSWIWWSLASLFVTAAVVMFARRYRDRSPTFVARGATLACGIAVTLFPVFTTNATLAGSNDGIGGVTLRMPVAGDLRCANQSLVVPVLVSAPLGWRVGLMLPRLTVLLSDGSAVSLAAPNWYQLVGSNGPMLPTVRDRSTWRVLGGDGDAAERLTRIEFQLSPQDAARSCGHIARLSMMMWVTTTTGEEMLRVAATPTAHTDRPGYRARIVSANLHDSDIAITARVSMLAGQGAGQLDNLGDLGFALMNPTRHELVRLMSRNEDVASSISELPGLRHIASTHYLELYASDSGRPRGLEAWRDSTVLLVTAVVERGRGWKQVDAVVAP